MSVAVRSDMWFDKVGALATLDAFVRDNKCPVDPANVKEFLQKGYTVIKGAVSHEKIDRFNSEVEHIQKNPDGFYASFGSTVRELNTFDLGEPLTKLLDLYSKSNAAREVLLAPQANSFLRFMFQDSITLFQSLYFLKGSTQDIHQDPAYVVVDQNPHNLIAIWVALEDIEEGSGELVYIEGSHRDFMFSYPENRIHWESSKDGHPVHDHHLAELRKLRDKAPERVKTFLPKKGDVLFWHANLAHGGSKVISGGKTRRSIVGHFCPSRTSPHYVNLVPNRYSETSHGIHYCSLYYDRSAGGFK